MPERDHAFFTLSGLDRLRCERMVDEGWRLTVGIPAQLDNSGAPAECRPAPSVHRIYVGFG
jgi:hypothetical protein